MKGLVILVACVALVLASTQSAQVVLRDGSTRYRGRVEVTLEGETTARQVCSSDVQPGDAEGLCKAAGFDVSSALTRYYGIKGGLEFVDVRCTEDTDCEYTPKSDGYTCPDEVLGLDCTPSLGTTGSVGLEAGIIAGILICLVAIIGIGLGLSVCLYRNDLIPCFQNTAAT